MWKIADPKIREPAQAEWAIRKAQAMDKDAFVHRQNKKYDSPAYVRGFLSSWSDNKLSTKDLALAFLTQHKALYKMDDPASQLDWDETRTLENGKSYVRFLQVHRGSRVLGGHLTVHLNKDKSISGVSGVFHPGIDVDPGSIRITRPQAERIALEATKGRFVSTRKGDETEKVVFMEGGGAKLAWRVTVARVSKRVNRNEAPSRWECLVDAMGDPEAGSGAVLTYYNLARGALIPEPVAPEESALLRFNGFRYSDGLYCVKTVNKSEPLDPRYRLQDVSLQNGLQFSTKFCEMGEEEYQRRLGKLSQDDIAKGLFPCESKICTAVGDNIFTDPVKVPIADCHAISHMVVEFFGSLGLKKDDGPDGVEYGLDPLAYIAYHNHHGGPMYDDNEINIFDGLSLDDGTPVYSSFNIFEVIAHEWTHMVIRKGGSVYAPYDWPGALEEALCDSFACIMKKALLDSESWYLLAEEGFLMRKDEVLAGKNLKDPMQGFSGNVTRENAASLPQFGHQAGHMDQCIIPEEGDRKRPETDYGWVHFNCGVINRATYLMLNGSDDPADPFPAIDVNVLAYLYYHVMTCDPGYFDDFWDFRFKLLMAVKDIYEQDLNEMLLAGNREDALKEIDNWLYIINKAFELVGIKHEGGQAPVWLPPRFSSTNGKKVRWKPLIKKGWAAVPSFKSQPAK